MNFEMVGKAAWVYTLLAGELGLTARRLSFGWGCL
jgi:hypothetical protein